VTSLVLSWSITEVIRYSFFALKETFGYTPRFLLWLRYTTFFVLYPTGICSEAGLVFVTLPFMQVSCYSFLTHSLGLFSASLLTLKKISGNFSRSALTVSRLASFAFVV
jgi:hypothetical protein